MCMWANVVVVVFSRERVWRKIAGDFFSGRVGDLVGGVACWGNGS